MLPSPQLITLTQTIILRLSSFPVRNGFPRTASHKATKTQRASRIRQPLIEAIQGGASSWSQCEASCSAIRGSPMVPARSVLRCLRRAEETLNSSEMAGQLCPAERAGRHYARGQDWERVPRMPGCARPAGDRRGCAPASNHLPCPRRVEETLRGGVLGGETMHWVWQSGGRTA